LPQEDGSRAIERFFLSAPAKELIKRFDLGCQLGDLKQLLILKKITKSQTLDNRLSKRKKREKANPEKLAQQRKKWKEDANNRAAIRQSPILHAIPEVRNGKGMFSHKTGV
jgi:hypothetical protein